MREADQCEMCGGWWEEDDYCPECQEEIDAITEAEDACPLCHKTSPDPGHLCPPCAEVDAENRTEEEEV
jgi:RNA polymerase subunit RPABC4/transcription elongation factor Spt4